MCLKDILEVSGHFKALSYQLPSSLKNSFKITNIQLAARMSGKIVSNKMVHLI